MRRKITAKKVRKTNTAKPVKKKKQYITCYNKR